MVNSDIVVTSFGFASDAYDLFAINLALKFLQTNHSLSTTTISLITTMALVGSCMGQLSFGYLAKKLGRTKTAVLTLCIIALGAFGSSVLTLIEHGFLIQLIVWRWVVGYGIGGEYPLSSTLAWEKSTADKIKNTGMVFSMQGFGSLLAPVVVLILMNMTHDTDIIWRLSLGFGLVPCLLLIYPRVKMHETQEFSKFVDSNEADLTPKKKKIMWLIGTAGCWLIFDIAFYANGLFNATITDILHMGSSLEQQSLNSLYLALIALPGYFFGVWLVQRFDMKYIQTIGFFFIGALFLIMGLFDDQLKKYPVLFMIIYGLTFFFSNCGPNMTTYIMPAKFFHVSERPFYHGISAAAGKIGAIIGSSLLKPCLDVYGINTVLFICAGLSFLGIIWTLVFIPSEKETNAEPDVLLPVTETNISYNAIY